MIRFTKFLSESVGTEDKLKHLEHAEDHHINAGAAGFKHAVDTLNGVHNQLRRKDSDVNVTMKYDGSPSVVFGYHPQDHRFFVASKSAFKLNYTDQDIEDNHGHAPGLVAKLKAALKHLPKITPKGRVFQGDLMHTPEDVKDDGENLNFKPNTITYSVPRDSDVGKKVARSKLGVAIHTEEFAHFAGGVLGDSAVVTGAQAMAMTVIDLWTQPDLCAQLSSEFAQVTSDIDVLA